MASSAARVLEPFAIGRWERVAERADSGCPRAFLYPRGTNAQC